MVFLAVSCVTIVVVHCRYALVYLVSAVIAAVHFELLRNFQFPRSTIPYPEHLYRDLSTYSLRDGCLIMQWKTRLLFSSFYLVLTSSAMEPSFQFN